MITALRRASLTLITVSALTVSAQTFSSAATAAPKAGRACPAKSVNKAAPGGQLVCKKVGKFYKWTATATTTTLAKAATNTTVPASAAPATAATLTGVWKTAAGTVAGYRIKENLRLADIEAVGRTESVVGSVNLTQDGANVTASNISVEVDMTTLKSDSAQRDNRIKEIGLESTKFPKSTFVSTGDIAVPKGYDSADGVGLKIPGKLTLHGVTKDVTFDAKIRLTGDTVEVIVAHEIILADYSIEKINLGFVVIEDRGVLETKLVMKK
jgi:polyisoprenoid-binding protein YceI